MLRHTMVLKGNWSYHLVQFQQGISQCYVSYSPTKWELEFQDFWSRTVNKYFTAVYCTTQVWVMFKGLEVLANEDTLLRTHCCRQKCFPVCPRVQHLLRTQILCPGHENVSEFVQKHFVSATNVSQFAQPKTHHGQQCVRNNVSSFTRALSKWLRTDMSRIKR